LNKPDRLANRLTLAEHHMPVLSLSGAPESQAPTYTPGPFPKAGNDANPMAAYVHLDHKQAETWASQDPTTTVIARVLDGAAKDAENLASLASMIARAAADIGGGNKPGIAIPKRNTSTLGTANFPSSFLIHGLTTDAARALLAKKFVISKEVAFQTIPVDQPLPTLMCIIAGLTTSDPALARSIALENLQTEGVLAALEELQNEYACKEVPFTSWTLASAINHLSVQRLDTKAAGGYDVPEYALHIETPLPGYDEAWYAFRKIITSRTFSSDMHGVGIVMNPGHKCTLCNGMDHPRGLCPLPDVPLYYGPSRKQTAPTAPYIPVYRRYQSTGGQSRGRGGHSRGGGNFDAGSRGEGSSTKSQWGRG
jgi:hypothetical protein